MVILVLTLQAPRTPQRIGRGGQSDLVNAISIGKYLSVTEMQFDLLAIRNETFLRDLVYYEEVGSTNTALLDIAQKSPETPIMVLAQRQLAGRGRGSNSWWSNVGAVTFSLLLDFPMLEPDALNSFSLTAGLAICQAIEKHAPAADLALKWPNDVYLNGKKVAGILIERPVATEPSLVVGIGINANNELRDAPEDVAKRATSLRTELGDPIDPNRLLIDCLHEIERRSREQVHHPTELLDQWRAYCMLTGRDVEVTVGNQVSAGMCMGIDSDGALLLDSEGSLQRIVAGAVTHF